MSKPTSQMNNSTTQGYRTAKRKTVKSLIRDFNIYAKRFCPESKTLVRRFQITKETKGTWGHIDCIVHILKLEMSFIEEDSKRADRGLFHMCRDVMEWVYGTNKAFSGSPCASIIREYVHRKLQPHKPFPMLRDTQVKTDDSCSESEDDERSDSGVDAADTPSEDQDSQDDSQAHPGHIDDKQAHQGNHDDKQTHPGCLDDKQDLRGHLDDKKARQGQHDDKRAPQGHHDDQPSRQGKQGHDDHPASPKQPPRRVYMVKRRISLPKKKPPMIDISSPNKTKRKVSPERDGWDTKKLAYSNKGKREVSPERDGWDTKKLAFTDKTPDTKKRKLDVEEGKETRSYSKKLKAKTKDVEYQTFEMSWNENNNPDHWLDQLKGQGAYNPRCRCTLITKDGRKHLVVKFPTTDKNTLKAFQKMKEVELAMMNITSVDELDAKRIPVQAHGNCFRFD